MVCSVQVGRPRYVLIVGSVKFKWRIFPVRSVHDNSRSICASRILYSRFELCNILRV